MADEPQDAPQDEPTPEEAAPEAPAAEEPEAPAAEAVAEEPEAPAAEAVAEEPVAEAGAAEEPPEDVAVEEAAAGSAAEEPDDVADRAEDAAAEAERPKPKRRKDAKSDEPEVIPGAHLEPDLVLEDDKRDDETGYAGAEVEGESEAAEVVATSSADGEEDEADHGPLEAVLDLAADARYRATGKRKSAIARVTLKPGSGSYEINGRTLEQYFPRPSLRTLARRPLETVGQQDRMDVVAKIHGGGVSAQAGALRHGITRALVEADPNLRGELKRRGFLTRDPRVKERKKAGLKKARKRPQFSKR